MDEAPEVLVQLQRGPRVARPAAAAEERGRRAHRNAKCRRGLSSVKCHVSSVICRLSPVSLTPPAAACDPTVPLHLLNCLLQKGYAYASTISYHYF